MPTAEKTREVIVQLKKIRAENGYTLQNIQDIVLAKGGDISLSTIRNVFAEGSEDKSFRYQETIRPIASALLDITTEAVKAEENSEIATLKAIIIAKEAALESEQRNVQHLVKESEKKDSIISDRGAYIRHYQQMVDERKEFLQNKDELIDYLKSDIKRLKRYVFGLSVVAAVFFLYILLIDFPNPDYGFGPFLRGLFGI